MFLLVFLRFFLSILFFERKNVSFKSSKISFILFPNAISKILSDTFSSFYIYFYSKQI